MDAKKCNTFVFLDLETTGLPQSEVGKTRIIEMCMISIKRKHLLRTDGQLPRTLSKLNILFYPEKELSSEITDITGLTSKDLEDELPFNEKKVALIKSFLGQLKPPICLVAHNGNPFDFGLLKEELKLFDEIVPLGTQCADTIPAFRYLHESSNYEKYAIFSPFITKTDIEFAEALDSIEKQFSGKTEEEVKEIMEGIRQSNETTPKSKIMGEAENRYKISAARRRLMYSDGDACVSPKNISYRLKDLYKILLGCDQPIAHQAESDAIALIKCCLRFGQPILDWFDHNSVEFSNIKPTYSF